ncbi:MAG: glycosyltransferase [Chitinivibrionales bacterium]|nr:glycosyltransferase [Chitinivibrionales bacterium]MBD3396204.1 glycosyltransferase [Chitinivibrionales bacterium]
MRIALIHEWLVTLAGAESVLQSIHRLYPGDIHALFHDPDELAASTWARVPVKTSMLQHLPFARKHHRAYLPLYPMAIEQFDLREYNLIISSSYAVAKGVLTSSDQLHICYCHSPMRYVWDLTFQYLEAAELTSGLKSFLVRAIFHYIRTWDSISSLRVNEFVANSHYIAHRIEKCYNRTARVIYPPVDVDRFTVRDRRDDYFITVSRLVPYKRIDLAVEAFNQLGLPLLVVGEGPAKRKLKSLAKKNITFAGNAPDEQLRDYLSRARAFVFCAEEDFGIVNVEAQACGIPVIAYGRGGALETVIEGETGLFFYRQNVPSLVDAVNDFLASEDSFDPKRIRANAERFPRARFEKEFKAFVDDAWERFPYKK